MFLYSKEGWIIAIDTRLWKIKPTYDKKQDATILNWGSD